MLSPTTNAERVAMVGPMPKTSSLDNTPAGRFVIQQEAERVPTRDLIAMAWLMGRHDADAVSLAEFAATDVEAARKVADSIMEKP